MMGSLFFWRGDVCVYACEWFAWCLLLFWSYAPSLKKTILSANERSTFRFTAAATTHKSCSWLRDDGIEPKAVGALALSRNHCASDVFPVWLLSKVDKRNECVLVFNERIRT